jgi:urease accessory protein
MATDAALLQLIWLASPALPVGAFSYSEGLESAVDAGLVHDEASTRAWLLDQLHLVQARADLATAGAAFAAWRAHDLARAEAVNAWVQTTRETAEQRLQAEQAGRSMAEWLRQRDADADPPDARVAALRGFAPAPTWPVAVALAAARSEAEARDALLAIAFGWAENMVQAAVKAVPLGQSAGQRVLAALAEAIPQAVDTAMSLDDETRQAFAPALAILGARHETQYSRLFRS